MVDVVNTVGGGSLQREIDLNTLEKDLCVYSYKFNPNKPSRMYLQLRDESPTISLFRSGKYSIAGAESISKLEAEDNQFKQELERLGVVEEYDNLNFNIRYLVGIGDLGYRLDLSETLTRISENAEYEPEQFPGLYYSPTEDTTYIIFASGKVSINGPKSVERLEEQFTRLKQILD